MRSNGQLTRTEAATARKLLRVALSRNDRKKTGSSDQLRLYVNNFQYGEVEHRPGMNCSRA